MLKTLTQRTEFYSVWKKFVTKGIAEGIPESIKDSWKRCREMGIDPLQNITPIEIDQKAVKEKIERNCDLHNLLQYHYKDIEKEFDFAPFVILFSDADGYVLSISGHDELLKLSARGTIKMGSNITEGSIGTTAPGITLVEHKSSKLTAEEHYSHLFHWASCSAIPILDNQNNILGCLDFTTTVEHSKKLEHLTSHFCSIANSLQFELFLKKKLQQLEIYSSYFQSTFEFADKILILVNRSGDIINLNTKAQMSFRVNSNEFINRNVRELLNIDSSKFNSLLKGLNVVKLTFPHNRGLKLFAEGLPIVNQSGDEIAYLLKLEKEKTSVTVPKKNPNIARFSFKNIIGQSEQISCIIDKAKKVARTSSNVLIEGETGTGKELFAHAIHNESDYCHGPFVAINCCAIPNELLESELFGYEKGAYTGSKKDGNIGKFELANGGTIFLDEIHAMDPSAQMKILRLIEDRQVMRVGGTHPIPLNIRIIVASTKCLEDEVAKGNFLPSLFFRLNVVRLHLPNLSERKEDIPFIVNYFIKEMNEKFKRSIQRIEPEALKALSRHPWPGNIRELRNCIEIAFNFCVGEAITLEEINSTDIITTREKWGTERGQTIEEITESLLVESLSRFGTVKEAANFLGISASTFYRKMKKFSMSK